MQSAQDLLEREEELRGIRELLVRAGEEGRGGLLVIVGGPGIGKSALLAAAEAEASRRQVEVLRARGSEFGRDYGFALCIELFETRLARASDAEREELLGGAAGASRLALEPAHGAQPGVGSEQLFPALHGLRWLIANLAERSPLLLSIDDVHWADSLSLRFLLYLANHLAEAPVAVAVALRPFEPGTDDELLRSLRERKDAGRLSPAPLSAPAIASVVRARMPGAEEDFCAACARAAGGNPLDTWSLVMELRARRVKPDAANAELVERIAPRSTREAVATRLGRLGEDALALARAAAVLGDDAKLSHAARLAELEEGHAVRLAGLLVSSEILAAAEPLRFAHPLVRAAVRSEVPSAELAERHGRTARLLGVEGTPPDRVAGHLLESAPAADPWVVDVLRRAAALAVSRGSPGDAVRYLRRALREPPSPESHPHVLLELGRAEATAGEAAARQRFDDALALLDDPADRADGLLCLGELLYQQGRLGEAVAAFSRGLRTLEQGGLSKTDLAKDLQAGYVASASAHGGHGEAREWARELAQRRDGAATVGERKVLAGLAFAQLLASAEQGATLELTGYVKRLLSDGALLATEGPASISLWNAAGCLYYTDDLDGCERITEAALAEGRRLNAFLATAWWLIGRSLIRYARGRIGEGVTDSQAALEASWDGWHAGSAQVLPAAMAAIALGLIEQGEIEAAGRALRLPEEERWPPTFPVIVWRWVRGRQSYSRGDAASSLADLRTVGGHAVERLGLTNPAVIPWRSDAALAARALGERGEARRLADEELRLARRVGIRRSVGVALRAAGLVNDGREGVDLLREAVDVLERSPSRLELCRACVDLGAALRRDGARSQAGGPLRRGLDMAHRFGALALADQAEQELRAAGARPRRRMASGPGALTPSERRVAELAAGGSTNKDIAQALFVTVKGVEWHLRNAYVKLGIDSRKDLHRALGEAGTEAEGQPRGAAS